MVQKWSMAGEMLGACSCDWGCPCSFDARPTKGFCEGSYIWAVRDGHYGDTPLSGLVFVWAGHFDGPVHEGNGTTQFVVDEKSTAAQREAIEALAAGGGQGMPWDIFAAVTATRHPTIYAGFDLKLAGIRSELSVGGGSLLQLGISRIRNPVTSDEEEIYLDKPTGFTSKRTELGMSNVFRIATEGIKLDHSGQYAEHAEFSYSGG